MTNWALRQYRDDIRGVVVDLASGKQPSYWRLMDLEKAAMRLVRVDFMQSCEPTVVADISELPLKHEIADVVIIGGSLMHVVEPLNVMKQAVRLLRRNGVLIFSVPFIFNHAPDPRDFWRFTPDSIEWLLGQCGEVNTITIVPVGDRWCAVGDLILGGLPFRWLFGPMVVVLCLALDRLYWWASRRAGKQPASSPLAYVVKATLR